MKSLKMLVLFFSVASMALAQETIKMQVKESKVHCTGVGPMEYLQVKTGKEKEWTYFYENIEGFDFESGYRYKLKVEKKANAKETCLLMLRHIPINLKKWLVKRK